jgi:hypothetical protein
MSFIKSKWQGSKFEEKLEDESSNRKMDYSIMPVSNKNTRLAVVTLEIGDWDMDANDTVDVFHNLGDKWKSIRSISVILRHDNDDTYYDLFSASGTNLQASINSITNEYVQLWRANGSWWDGVNYDSTNYNRGWVTIWYEVT